MKIFDTHVHFPIDLFDKNPAFDDSVLRLIDDLAAELLKAGVTKACLFGARGNVNNMVKKACEMYPGLFVGMPLLQLGVDDAAKIDEFREAGFKGVKCIFPKANYDCETYIPLYKKLEAYGMPAVFHTGIVGGGLDFYENSPFDEEAVKKQKEFEPKYAEFESSSLYMHPLYLDNINRYCPDLKIIGAHVGYGFYDCACFLARWKRNIFFDLSGGNLVRRNLVDRGYLFREISGYKVLFASDVHYSLIKNEIDAWNFEFDKLRIGHEARQDIFYNNAARLFGINLES